MLYLVDTNIVIYLAANAYPRLSERVATTEQGAIRLSTIVFAEVALGSENGLAPSSEALAILIEQMPLVPFDEAAARAYARLPFKRGRFDRLLAAHAISLNATILSRNLADFQGIKGLQVEDWTR